MMDESEMAQAIVEQWHDEEHRTHNVSFEEHYNHYGTRGVVDLVDEWQPKPEENSHSGITIAELKSESALSNATGANEILRQFKKHIEYFFEGSDYPKRKYDEVSYFLIFYATEDTVQHLRENKMLYNSVDQNGYSTSVKTVAWHEETDHYAHVIHDKLWEKAQASHDLREVIA